jgi:hypothetical protein
MESALAEATSFAEATTLRKLSTAHSDVCARGTYPASAKVRLSAAESASAAKVRPTAANSHATSATADVHPTCAAAAAHATSAAANVRTTAAASDVHAASPAASGLRALGEDRGCSCQGD